MQESRTLPTGLMMVRMKKANGEVIGKEGDDGMGVKTMFDLDLVGCGVFLAWQGIVSFTNPLAAGSGAGNLPSTLVECYNYIYF